MNDVIFALGHQSYAPGAANMNGPGQHDDIYEHWFNKPIVTKAVEILKADGVDAKMGLYEDPGGWRAWSGQSALLVEAHCNAFNTRATGTETLYWHTSTRGKAAAETMQRVMVNALRLSDRGIKPRMAHNRGAYLLRGVSQVALITEPGFIDNDKDLARMSGIDMAAMYVAGIKAALRAIQ